MRPSRASLSAVVLAGLRRLVLMFAAVAALSSVGGLAIGALAGYPLGRAVPVGLDLGGALMLLVGLFVGIRGPVRLHGQAGVPLFGSRRVMWLTPREREEKLNASAVFVVLGLLLILLGLVSDTRVRLV